MTLKDKTIIVTGASSGIGERLAHQIASQGGNLLLTARSEEKLTNLQTELKELYSIDCRIYKADLLDLNAWKSALNKMISDVPRIDAIINNAGFGIFDKVEEESKWEDTENMFRLNVFALIQGIQQLLPHFISNRAGHIVNIASQAGKISTPKSASYAATKHAVIGFSNALRLEVEDYGIYVTSVNLGPVATNFFHVADPSGTYQKSVSNI
ncbi:SDR family NAD(P)-dependent oxidoreductase [Radiobacillus deserti]|uniref:SDR family NAD(P)-dependent oxidoreductase n=1 Tax=Radiobacillus deserti TaxID=2594883 RepID=UPI002B20A18D|nr:SDR family oxidoreductase [Radiobacillus deserti]